VGRLVRALFEAEWNIGVQDAGIPAQQGKAIISRAEVDVEIN